MNYRIEADDLILLPESDLVASHIEELRDYFSEQIRSHTDISRILLDVSGVEVVDSLGVNLVVGLYRQAEAEDRSIEIIGANKNFMKVANFFRLPALFPVKAAGVS